MRAPRNKIRGNIVPKHRESKILPDGGELEFGAGIWNLKETLLSQVEGASARITVSGSAKLK